jgi:hypothetical protein
VLGFHAESLLQGGAFIQIFPTKTAAACAIYLYPISLHYRTLKDMLGSSSISLLDSLENGLRGRKTDFIKL